MEQTLRPTKLPLIQRSEVDRQQEMALTQTSALQHNNAVLHDLAEVTVELSDAVDVLSAIMGRFAGIAEGLAEIARTREPTWKDFADIHAKVVEIEKSSQAVDQPAEVEQEIFSEKT